MKPETREAAPDEPLVKCWFHAWGKWKDVSNGNLNSAETKGVIGKLIIQERRCQKCNRAQLAIARAILSDHPGT